MPFTPSKIRTGVLSFAIGAATPTDFAVPATSVRLTPSYDDGDAVRFIDGSEIAADTVRSDSMTIEFVQDFEDTDGLVHYLWSNDLEEAAFVWETGSAGEGGMRWTGSVQLRAPEVGGENNAVLSSEIELPVVGAITGPTVVS